MIDKIKSLSNQSKYTAWYCNIVENAIGRKHTKGNERHHIVPKSIWKEGAKLKDNLVSLTPREHFICHRLLIKMLSGVNKSKMSFALWRLTHKRKSDGVAVTSHDYGIARESHSAAISKLWEEDGHREKTIDARKWFYESEEQKQANREKALKEMQDPDRKASFVKAGLAAGKTLRDSDTKAWVANSMGSSEGRAKAKAASQTQESREKARLREMSKTKEERTALAKMGQLALMEKLGGEVEYRKYLSDRAKGRKKYIDLNTLVVSCCKEQPTGSMLLTEYNKLQNVA